MFILLVLRKEKLGTWRAFTSLLTCAFINVAGELFGLKPIEHGSTCAFDPVELKRHNFATTNGSPFELVSCTWNVATTQLPSLKVIATNEGESPLKQINVTKKPNVESLKHRRFNLFSSELPTFYDVLIEFQQDDQEPQTNFMVVASTKPMNKSASMRLLFLNHVVISQW